MAQGGITPNQNKHNAHRHDLEFEDFGTTSLYLYVALIVLVAIGLVILFGMIVASGAIAVSEAVNG